MSPELGTNWSRLGVCDVADVDGNGLDEVLFATASYYDDYFAVMPANGAATTWTSPIVNGITGITHGDLNGDGVDDLVGITQDGTVYAWDIAHQTSLWTSTSLGPSLDVAAVDLDGDHKAEVIALTSTFLQIYKYSAVAGTWVLQASCAAPAGSRSLLVADTDGDGIPELLLLTADGVVRYDVGLNPLSSFQFPGLTSLALEASASPRKNLIASLAASSDYYATASTFIVLDSVTGDEIWHSPLLSGTSSAHSLSFPVLPGETQPRLALGTRTGMFLSR